MAVSWEIEISLVLSKTKNTLTQQVIELTITSNKETKMRDEDKIEADIVAAGKTAPRLTPDHINSCIREFEYHNHNEVLTICIMTLVNGFIVTGESACADPANYDRQIGQDIAYANAKDKIWALEGYLLREKLCQCN